MSMPEESGATRLLNRDTSTEYVLDWTTRVAAPKKLSQAGTLSVVVFRLGPEWLALPTALFQEVAEKAAFHSLPHRTGFASGLASIRGELLICVSLEDILGLVRTTPNSRRFLVADRRGERLVFPVDEVVSVHRYHPSELRPVPATLGNGRSRFTLGLLPWRERSVGCLDEDAVFQAVSEGLV
jgi:chemotaxis-related protein WspD